MVGAVSPDLSGSRFIPIHRDAVRLETAPTGPGAMQFGLECLINSKIYYSLNYWLMLRKRAAATEFSLHILHFLFTWTELLYHTAKAGQTLLQYQHPPRRCEISRGQRIEIEATGNRLTELVTPVPIGCTAAASIDTRCLMSYRQPSQ